MARGGRIEELHSAGMARIAMIGLIRIARIEFYGGQKEILHRLLLQTLVHICRACEVANIGWPPAAYGIASVTFGACRAVEDGRGVGITRSTMHSILCSTTLAWMPSLCSARSMRL